MESGALTIELQETVESGPTSQIQTRDPRWSVLYENALQGDWISTQRLLEEDEGLLGAALTERDETALHVATGAGQVTFVRELIERMSPEQMSIKDRTGNTAFCIAVAAGSMDIAQIMLRKDRSLLETRGAQDLTPVNLAVLLGKTQMAYNLLREARPTSYLTDEDCIRLFIDSINNDLYGLSWDILPMIGYWNIWGRYNNESAWHVLARKPASTFANRSQAFRLLDRIFLLGATEDPEKITALIRGPPNLLFDAARLGNFYFVELLMDYFPHLIYELNDQGQTIFHVAIQQRQFHVFDLINRIGFNKEIIGTCMDNMGNSMLHLAATYKENNSESDLSSAALQMQQELIFFKEVEKLTQPAVREKRNTEGLTPQELFQRSHAGLQKVGAEWMNNSANSCSFVATLIATVVFAAAFTVPGGTDDKTGTPLFLNSNMFHLFAISDAIALSSSSFSILTFLSILTSGYKQSQFLISLPLKLMVGIFALFISILFMMVTFTSAFFLHYHNHSYTIPLLVALFVTIPTILFVLLQIPLLRDMLRLINQSGILSMLKFHSGILSILSMLKSSISKTD